MSEQNRPTALRLLICTVLTAAILPAFYWGIHNSVPDVVGAETNRERAASGPHGELIYVPIYSSIFYENGKQTLELAATLSIHNVNPDKVVTIIRADYYDTSGKLIKQYADKPVRLNPLQTTSYVIDKSNTAGGTGANFLVEWQALDDVTSPLIEAVMINASSNLGIAFTSTGKVVRSTGPMSK